MVAPDRARDSFVEARAFVERARACEREAPAAAIGWYDRALASLGDWSELLVDVLRWKGSAHSECGDTKEADRLYERSAEIANEIGYLGGEAHAANCRATVAQRRGDLGAAERLYTQANELARRAGDSRLRAMVQRNLGILASTRGVPEQAIGHYEESLEIAQAMNDDDGVLRALNNMARLYLEQGQNRDAEEMLEVVVKKAGARGDTILECTAMLISLNCACAS